MVQLWLIAVLLLPACRNKPAGKGTFIDNSPAAVLKFTDNPPPPLFLISNQKEYILVGSLSSQHPDYTVEGKAECYKTWEAVVPMLPKEK